MYWLVGILLITCLSFVTSNIDIHKFPKPVKSNNGVDIKYKTLYSEQQVDHFGYANQDMFKMRYLLADQYWDKDGGPIFFYCGNEGDIAWFCNNTGIMWEWAPQFKAMLVFAEHRYYGESLPYGNDSYKDMAHLGYLSSEQALADYASLLLELKNTIPGAKKSPIIAFGGSYGGMLAAWFRMKYPHVVQGSLAASAPIWMFGNLTPCDTFYKLVTADFKKSGPNCAENIHKSWAVIDEFGKTDTGREFLRSSFKLCDPLKSVKDVEDLKGWLYNTYGNLAMVDYPYPASFLEPLPAWPIKEACIYLSNGSLIAKDLISNLAKVVSLYFNYTGDKKCLNTSQHGVKDLGDFGWQFQAVCEYLDVSNPTEKNLISHLVQAVGVYFNYTGTAKCLSVKQQAVKDLGDKGWDFQACSEMVMPICATGVNDMFEPNPFNLTSFAEDCKKTWGVVTRPQWALTVYGGKDIIGASNIIFSNGGLDPWSGGGVLSDISPSLISIFISEGAHHLDLRSSHPDDPESVTKARSQEKEIIQKWIKEYSTISYMEYIMESITVVGSGPRVFNDSPQWIKHIALGIASVIGLVGIISIFMLVKSPKHKQRSQSGILIVSPCDVKGSKNIGFVAEDEKALLL